jgi:hypothetical protein
VEAVGFGELYVWVVLGVGGKPESNFEEADGRTSTPDG